MSDNDIFEMDSLAGTEEIQDTELGMIDEDVGEWTSFLIL